MEASLTASSRSFATFWAITKALPDRAMQSNVVATEIFRNILFFLLLAVVVPTLLSFHERLKLNLWNHNSKQNYQIVTSGVCARTVVSPYAEACQRFAPTGRAEP